MMRQASGWAIATGLAGCLVAAGARAQVFVVGERSATADIKTDFEPTHVELQDKGMTELARRELIRGLVGEQGFAHRALPMGAGLTLQANGGLKPGPEAYKKMIYEKGSSAAPGDRVAVTALEVKGDRLVIDFNGGPYLKHRFLRHISINGADPASSDGAVATGSRVTLMFEGGVPEVSAPEVKALLEPVIDFGAKKPEQAYADTLPGPVKSAIASHEVLVGMNHRMVLAALGAPESKVREQVDGERYEEWIYGHVPQTVKFVRFSGDRVSLVKIAAYGKAIDVHKNDELAGYLPPAPERVIAQADGVAPDHAAQAPTLLKGGEKAEAENGTTERRVVIPKDTTATPASAQAPATPGTVTPGTAAPKLVGAPSTL
jgi:hypothetical protein